MPDNNLKSRIPVRKLTLLAIFLAYALIIGIIERSIPIDVAVPGVRLGLSNVVVLTALYIFSFPEALLLVVLKCVLTAFFSGSFTSFLYSISGSLLSACAMALLIKLLKEKISPIGISVVGAVCHNLGQIVAASFVMGTWLVATYSPVLMVSGVITGILVGFAVQYTMPFIKRYYKKQQF